MHEDLHPLRREPYRLLFPIGFILAWAGVAHWLFLGLGLTGEYRSIFHAMTQIQGFMSALAAGFLLTFVPRRTGAAPPRMATVVLTALMPIGTTVSAWFERWAWSQLFWLVFVFALFGFALGRLKQAKVASQLPDSFVWVGVALVVGIVGSIVTGVAAAMGPDWMWLHDIGRAALLQGLMCSMVLGVGSVLLPILLRGDRGALTASWGGRLAHLAAAVLFFSSFWLEGRIDMQLGFGLRGGVAAGVLLGTAQLWRPPRLPGLFRWLAWIGGWCVPLGFLLVAVMPSLRKSGLHVVFLGAFGLLALVVSSHVAVAHAGEAEGLAKRPWRVGSMGLLLLAAVGARLMIDLQPERFSLWIGVAASCFLAATLAWASIVVPKLTRPG